MAKSFDYILKIILIVCVFISVLTTMSTLFMIGGESVRFFSHVNPLDFFFGTEWTPLFSPESFGVLPLVAGTLFIVFVGVFLFALPLGLMVAIYLSEYASSKLRHILKPTIEVLAGIPTVVYGYFALTFITPQLKALVFTEIQVFNALSGAIVVGIMLLPMVSSLCDDALSAVPLDLKRGGYALGGTQFEVVNQIVLPVAFPRIVAAVILAVSRAVGETMAVTIAAGATPKLWINPLESIQTMTAYIVEVSLGDTPSNGIVYQTCFAVGALLFAITLIFNIIGTKILRRATRAL